MSVGVGKWENPFKREVMITHFLIFLKNNSNILGNSDEGDGFLTPRH